MRRDRGPTGPRDGGHALSLRLGFTDNASLRTALAALCGGRRAPLPLPHPRFSLSLDRRVCERGNRHPLSKHSRGSLVAMRRSGVGTRVRVTRANAGDDAASEPRL